ncbi:MAG TPA: ParA family protein [Burkholderiales bacterium]|jgi:chromosome partitioning protein
MTRVLAVTNQKGGVGKTTTSVNLAAGLSQSGMRVLLVDLDPQGNATMGSGVDKRALKASTYQMLLGLATADSVRQKSESGGYDLIPANRDLAGAEVELVALEHRESRLKGALASIASQYDFILLDCPPALNMLTLNGLVAADAVMIPMQCEYYALEGLSDLVSTIKKVRQHLNPKLEIEGLLRTMYDPRNTLAQQVSAQLQEHFGDKLYTTVIPRNVRLAEAPSFGAPAVSLDRECRGSQAYMALATEILNRSRIAAAA